MTRAHLLFALFALPTLMTACDCGDDSSGDDDAGACPASTDVGTILVTVEEPDSAPPLELVLTASDGSTQVVTDPGTVSVPGGPVQVEAHRTRTSGDLIGHVYVATVDATTVCSMPGETTELAVTITADPASNRLWVADAQGSQVLAFDEAVLASSGTPAPAAVLSARFTNPTSLTFGPDGRLWLTDAGHIKAFASADLAAGNDDASPAVELSGPAIDDGSLPGVKELAFDASGALWAAHVAGDRIMKFLPADLEASGEPAAAVTLRSPTVTGPAALAFDASGNLWVGGSFEGFAMFAAARLGSDFSGEPDIVITSTTPEPVVGPLGPAASLAFDSEGTLWAGYFGGNVVARYSPDDLLRTADLEPATQITLAVDALLVDHLFDEGDGLWVTGSAGKLARLGPLQLRASGSITPATVLEPPGLAYAESLAIYPPAAGTPITF